MGDIRDKVLAAQLRVQVVMLCLILPLALYAGIDWVRGGAARWWQVVLVLVWTAFAAVRVLQTRRDLTRERRRDGREATVSDARP